MIANIVFKKKRKMYLIRPVFSIFSVVFLSLRLCLCLSKENEVSTSNKYSSSFSKSYDIDIDVSNMTCETLQQNVAMVSAQFTVCAVENARPIRLCLNCVGIYEDVINAYTKLIDSSSHFAGSKCSDIFLKSDTLAVISMIYANVQNLWTEARCDDCYSESGKTNYSHTSQRTEQFFDTWNELSHCMNLTIVDLGNFRNTTCQNCSELYHKLESIYDGMVKDLSFPMCMDIVDTMNVTRHQWNYQFHCKQFNTSIGYTNIILTVLIALLPVTFYTVARFISVIEVIKIVQPKRRSFLDNTM